MAHVVVAPAGSNLDALFVGIKEYQTDRVVLVTPPGREKEAKQITKDLERFKIPVRIEKIKGPLMEEMFRVIKSIKDVEGEDRVIVNIATGDGISTCAALSAAFVNGLKAIGMHNGEVMMFPVMKFSYYNVLTERKMNILKYLLDKGKVPSLERMSSDTKMSLPLVSYHVNGNRKSPGLKKLGLIATTVRGGTVEVKLSTLGKLLVKGYVDVPSV